MHLKRFVYDKSGGLKKIDKRVDYKTELIINKGKVLSVDFAGMLCYMPTY